MITLGKATELKVRGQSGVLSSLDNLKYNGYQRFRDFVNDTLPDNYLLYKLSNFWAMDETGSGIRFDSWGNRDLVSTATNYPNSVDGILNSASYFSVDTEFLRNNNDGPSFGRYSAKTFSFFLKPDARGDSALLQLFRFSNSGGSGSFEVNIGWGATSQNSIGLYFDNDSGSITDFAAEGAWSHFFIVFPVSSSINDMEVYIDNVLTPHNVDLDSSSSIDFGSDNFIISSNLTARSITATVDEFIIWDRELTEEERNKVYNSKTGWEITNFEV